MCVMCGKGSYGIVVKRNTDGCSTSALQTLFKLGDLGGDFFEDIEEQMTLMDDMGGMCDFIFDALNKY